jgi:hypothetical protein
MSRIGSPGRTGRKVGNVGYSLAAPNFEGRAARFEMRRLGIGPVGTSQTPLGRDSTIKRTK